MRFSYNLQLSCLAIAGLSTVGAATIYNEATSGDLSDSGLAPTSITVGLGSNQIFGTTGRGAALDRDYFTINVPLNFELAGITVLPGTQSGGVSFIGLEAGSQVTLPTTAADATGLLGWWHYSPSDINTNILPEMAVPSMGSTGFTPPLAADAYSFWVQDFNTGSFAYGFDISVAPAPEPATYGMVLAALGVLAVVRSRGRLPLGVSGPRP
jgi:hypothetical protein